MIKSVQLDELVVDEMKLDHVELDELRIRPSGNRPTDNLPLIWDIFNVDIWQSLRGISINGETQNLSSLPMLIRLIESSKM